jgi:hypothetical protein
MTALRHRLAKEGCTVHLAVIGNPARRIVRAKPNEPDGRWEIQEYRFL